MPSKYDINEDIDDKVDRKLKGLTKKDEKEDINEFIDKLDRVKELDEQNPLERATKYRAVKQNPPQQGYMEVKCYEDKNEKNEPVVVSESIHEGENGKKMVKRKYHNPFFTVDLNKLIMADIAACPSNVGPMIIDMAQKLVEIKKRAFSAEKRTKEWNWWWIVLIILLIPGILTVIFMMLGG